MADETALDGPAGLPNVPSAYDVPGGYGTGAYGAGAYGGADLEGRATSQSSVSVGLAVSVDVTITRAPFSEFGIAERIIGNPEFYQWLARSAAQQLSNELGRLDRQSQSGKLNSVQTIRSALLNLK